MANKITLYRNCRILEANNFQVDSIDTYLNSIGSNKLEFADCQYIKNDLDLEIKINLGQEYLDKNVLNNYNYCVVQNDTGSKYYYFIRKMIWTAKSTIKLECHLDVLNTYSGKYLLSEKTNIIRQHKDRFETFPALSNEILSFLDNELDWNWGAGAGELVGIAQFQLPEEFVRRAFTSTITLVQGTGADVYSIDYDSDFAIVKITAYVQGEESQIPQGQIKITTVSAKVSPAKLTRKIDENSEGFDTVLFGNEEEVLTQEVQEYSSASEYENRDFGTDTWYLTYKTNNNFTTADGDKFIYDNPVNCLLTTDKSGFKVISKNDVIITKQDYIDAKASHPSASYNDMLICLPTGASGKKLPNSYPLDFNDAETVSHYLSIDILDGSDNVVKHISGVGSDYVSKYNHRRLKQTAIMLSINNQNKWVYTTIKIKRDNYALVEGTQIQAFTREFPENGKIRFNGMQSVIGNFSRGQAVDVWNIYKLYVTNGAGSSTFLANGSITANELISFKDINRTDQKLVKIINIPYLPIDINNSSLVYNATENQLSLNIDSNTKIGNYDPSFTNNIKLNINDYSYSPVSDLQIKKPVFSAQELRNDIYESKLYHSDFYQVKFIYDSFSYIFRNELADIKNISGFNNKYFNVDYCVSNSIASKFGFDFSGYYPLKKQYQDYNVLICSRNNEMSIYNNYYLNYLRSGALSNDLKNKQSQETAGAIGVAAGIATTVGGIVTAALGPKGIGAGMIISGIATTASSITNSISSSVQADRNLQQKLEQAKNQSASVSGSDDIGLLKWYADNNLCKLMKYQVSDITKERIADLFYYCGYNCNYQGIPNSTSRYWFNFVQCEPVFDDGSTYAKLSNEIKSELSNKYKEGITILHYHSAWDFDQVKENWENSLIS